MSKYSIAIRPYGIHAILIEWPNRVEEAILNNILAFIQHLKKHHLDDVLWEFVPSYNSLTLIQKEAQIDFEIFNKNLRSWYATIDENIPAEKFLWRLPVCYDLEFGLDLKEVSEKLNKSIPEVIEQHTSNIYTLYGIGFLPGFMYLGGLPEDLEINRKETPRLKVMKGSVGLAGKQTGIYPQESPGGWNIIGNCTVSLFDVKNETPCFVNVGDKIQFYSISRAEYDLHKIEEEVGIYKLKKIKIDA